MKIFYLTFLSALLFSSISAQITVTSDNNLPEVGDQFTYFQSAPAELNVSASGPDQTWDFSSLSGSEIQVDYDEAQNGDEAASFPNADMVETSGGAENYYVTSSTELTLAGHYQENVSRVIYSDLREFMKFPMSYEDSWDETFAGTLENFQAGQTFNRTGETEITADAYGDLILPYTTVENVLRVRTVNNYSDEFMGIPIGSFTDTIYVWYNATTKANIASYSVAYHSGQLLISQASYIAESDIVTSVGENEEPESQISYYPNPAKDRLIFSNSGNKTIVSIYDLNGRKVKETRLGNGRQVLNVADLQSGMYFVQYMVENQLFSKKLILK